MPPICRCDISFSCCCPIGAKNQKSAGIQRKDSCTKNACDLLSPYVGIIQIRFRVKASAYSQPACASTPFFCFPHHFCDGLFYNSFIIHACSQNASFFCINCCCHCHIYGNCMCREPISSATVSSLSCQVFWCLHLYYVTHLCSRLFPLIYNFGLRLPFGLRFDLQSYPPNRLIKFLFVGSRTLLHHFLHPYRYRYRLVVRYTWR